MSQELAIQMAIILLVVIVAMKLLRMLVSLAVTVVGAIVAYHLYDIDRGGKGVDPYALYQWAQEFVLSLLR